MHRPLKVILVLVLLFLVAFAGALLATAPRLLTAMTTGEAAAREVVVNPQLASRGFDQSSREAEGAYRSITSLPEVLQFPSLLPPFSWYVRLNKAAIYLSRAGKAAAQLTAAYPAPPSSTDPAVLLSAHSVALNTLATTHTAELDTLERSLELASTELSRVPSWIALGKHSELDRLKREIAAAAHAVQDGRSMLAGFQSALGQGSTEPHTILLIFQNNRELRPSGGFMGSYAVLTGTSGILRDYQFGGDIHKLSKAFTATKQIVPPVQLRTITPWMTFHDSNVGAGFLPEIGKQVAEIYGESTGTTPTALIFVDITLFHDLLALTGPLATPSLPVPLSAENAGDVLTQYIERDYWEKPENRLAIEPKTVIRDLIPLLISQAQATPDITRRLPELVRQATQRKALQIWSSDPLLQTTVQGALPVDTPPAGEWLKIVNTNIGGLKSSINVRQDARLEYRGRDRTLEIIRTHQGSGDWPDGENRNYTEVYLPVGTEVLEIPTSHGGEVLLNTSLQQELGMPAVPFSGEVIHTDQWTRVGFWSTTSVAEETRYTLKYRVSDERNRDHSFMYIKQAGTEQETFAAFGFSGTVSQNLLLEKPFRFW
jgi:hypothetical protein